MSYEMSHVFTRAVSTGYDSLLAVVYPQSCAVCGGSVERRALGVACATCWQRTQLFGEVDTICWKCGRPLGRTVNVAQPEQVRCHRCDDDQFTAARACGAYEGALRASILSLKREPHLCRKLQELLLATMARPPLNQATRISPVPLHPEREKKRGFNQASVIAQRLSQASSIPFDDASLLRTRHVERHRAGMDLKDRRKTVDDAFAVTYPRLVAGESFLLIDDVFTTGATASSCARALLVAGAASVFVLTIARPVRF